jgi:aspartyl/asparaginyl-tRNA synthetase
MKLNEDGKTVVHVDVLCCVGEFIGGSQREDHLTRLL